MAKKSNIAYLRVGVLTTNESHSLVVYFMTDYAEKKSAKIKTNFT